MVILGIKYGLFIQSVIDFIIIAFALFVFVKIANTLMKKEEVEEAVVKKMLYYLQKLEIYYVRKIILNKKRWAKVVLYIPKYHLYFYVLISFESC